LKIEDAGLIYEVGSYTGYSKLPLHFGTWPGL